MTEQEWLACGDLEKMLVNLPDDKVSERKCRLCASVICRHIWHLLDERGRRAVEVAERCADGLIGEGERHTASIAADASRYANAVLHALAYAANLEDISYAGEYVAEALSVARKPAVLCQFLRCIFGNLLRQSPPLTPAWRTPTVVALARAAYENRIMPAGTLEPVRLAVLADVLEEAGCDSPDILDHCRRGGEHVRGCWVVDLLLGKK
jgi:hypothetical protein